MLACATSGPSLRPNSAPVLSKRIYDDASRQQCVHVIPPTSVFFVLTRFWEATWTHNDKDTVLVRLIQQHLPQHKEPSKLFTQQGGTKERKGHPYIKISKETGKPTQIKRLALTFLLHFSRHIPLRCHRLSTVRGLAALTFFFFFQNCRIAETLQTSLLAYCPQSGLGVEGRDWPGAVSVGRQRARLRGGSRSKAPPTPRPVTRWHCGTPYDGTVHIKKRLRVSSSWR